MVQLPIKIDSELSSSLRPIKLSHPSLHSTYVRIISLAIEFERITHQHLFCYSPARARHIQSRKSKRNIQHKRLLPLQDGDRSTFVVSFPLHLLLYRLLDGKKRLSRAWEELNRINTNSPSRSDSNQKLTSLESSWAYWSPSWPSRSSFFMMIGSLTPNLQIASIIAPSTLFFLSLTSSNNHLNLMIMFNSLYCVVPVVRWFLC